MLNDIEKNYWVQIENRDRWLINEYKQINPANEKKYIDYWSKIKRRFIEGFWNEDFGQYRYASGKLQFYGNMCIILDVNKRTKARKRIRPFMRDLEWTMSYGLLTARGFSGFEGDHEYTCHHDVIEYKSMEDVPLDLLPILTNKDGSLKKYVPPKEYLHGRHDYIKGLPLYDNPAQDFFILGTRGGKLICPPL